MPNCEVCGKPYKNIFSVPSRFGDFFTQQCATCIIRDVEPYSVVVIQLAVQYPRLDSLPDNIAQLVSRVLRYRNRTFRDLERDVTAAINRAARLLKKE